MTCEELRDDYELYAMGLLDEPGRAELDAHLRREGDPCIAGVRRAREVVSSIALTAPEAHAPARLRGKVAGLVGDDGRRWSWTPVWIAVAAGLALVTIWLGISRRDRERTIADAERQLRQKNVELARLNEAVALMNDPAARQVVFGTDTAQPPRGRVFVNPKQGVLLLASNLPPAAAGKIYEMWLIPKGGKPVPAGLFQSESDGTALYLRKGAVDVAGTGAVAVTLEPEAGSPQPTTTPIIVAAL
jgi:anti-sigma-K factor RskA